MKAGGLLCALMVLGSSGPPADALSHANAPVAHSWASRSEVRRIPDSAELPVGVCIRLRGGQGGEMEGAEDSKGTPAGEERSPAGMQEQAPETVCSFLIKSNCSDDANHALTSIYQHALAGHDVDEHEQQHPEAGDIAHVDNGAAPPPLHEATATCEVAVK